MPHSRRFLAAALLILLASCGPATAPVSKAASTPAGLATLLSQAAEIRFALIGDVTDANVWALFDANGYSYNNYAVRSEYWPRLYRLSIPDRQFGPMAAGGMPSPIQQDGNFITATIPLRTDLTWTDGSVFSADDVAFTVNTVLSFQLGFDWHDYYNPDWLDHAEAVNAHTVKFYFKKQPNIGVWQYGALQGPVVQKKYWSPKIPASAALLPSSGLPMQIAALKAKVADLQGQVDALNASAATAPPNGEEARQTRVTLTHQEGELDQAINDLAKAQSDFEAALNAARGSMYALDHESEPTLGNWMPAGQVNGVWLNKVNPAHPFGEPHFDGTAYHVFVSEEEAIKALQNNDVDMILARGGVPPPSGSSTIASNLVNNLRVLAFNQANPALAVAALRQAIACAIWMPARNLSIPAGGFVLQGNDFWRNPQAESPCGEMGDASSSSWNAQARLEWSVQTLKAGGFVWNVEPTWDNTTQDGSAGKGLLLPNGQPFPQVVLLSPSKEYDQEQAGEAGYIEQQASLLGIPLTVRYVNPEAIRYAVFSSQQYDMALLGWRVSEYPDYLCDWFREGNPFHYESDRLKSACEALNSTSDIEAARQQVFKIQSILAEDLPFIPLYSGLTYDAYRNVTYPFDHVLDGLNGVYGAPSLAIPALH